MIVSKRAGDTQDGEIGELLRGSFPFYPLVTKLIAEKCLRKAMDRTFDEIKVKDVPAMTSGP